MISKKMWNFFIKNNLEKLFRQAKEYGLKVMFHSCGNVFELIPDLINIGMDIFDPVQRIKNGKRYQ